MVMNVAVMKRIRCWTAVTIVGEIYFKLLIGYEQMLPVSVELGSILRYYCVGPRCCLLLELWLDFPPTVIMNSYHISFSQVREWISSYLLLSLRYVLRASCYEVWKPCCHAMDD